jgi:hypothetical protein
MWHMLLVLIFMCLITFALFSHAVSAPLAISPPHGETSVPTATRVPDIIVNSTLDVLADDGLCTLREALRTSQTGIPGGSTPNECQTIKNSSFPIVLVPAGHYPLTLTGGDEDYEEGDLDFGDGLRTITIRGEGVARTIIDGMGRDRVMDVGGQIVLEDLAIINGQAPDIMNGGGIRHIATPCDRCGNYLLLRRVAVRNNRAGNATALSQGGNGGGIALERNYPEDALAQLWIEFSEISNNYAGIGHEAPGAPGPGNGGGIWAETSGGYIRWSTISSNYVDHGGVGGGFYNAYSPYITLLGVTIADNWIGDGTTGIGGGLFVENQTDIRGTLIANNHALEGPDCAGDVRSDAGNLVRTPSGCGFTPWVYDQIGVDPQLGVLQDNGGNGIYTHALIGDSPAIDQGLCNGDILDQRGFPRPVDIPHMPNVPLAGDVGAYERQPMPGDPTVTPTLPPTPSPTGTPVNGEQQVFLPLIQRSS